jgi:hypothetical protein
MDKRSQRANTIGDRLDVNADCDTTFDSFLYADVDADADADVDAGGIVELRVPSSRGCSLAMGSLLRRTKTGALSLAGTSVRA